jgi:hypothetical protein
MDPIQLLRHIAKEKYELELKSIELKRMNDLIASYDKDAPVVIGPLYYRNKTIRIQRDIVMLEMELHLVDIEQMESNLKNMEFDILHKKCMYQPVYNLKNPNPQ